MDSWPLPAQWVVLVLLSGTFLGCSWWLALARARADGAEPATWSGKIRTVVSSFVLGDWVVIALFVAFLIPLAIRTITGP